MRRLLAAGLLVVFGALLVPSPIQATTILKADEAYPVPEFTLTERSGRSVTKADLHGRIWVACFFFTSCNTICPQVTATMARLQDRLHSKGLDDVVLVSISVDPETDTPALLQKYAAGHGADPERWLFLTGKRDADVFPVANGFLLPAERNKGADRGNAVTHSPRLVLVDQEGRIRGYFDGRQVDEEGRPDDDLPELERAIFGLRGGFDFPSLNAALNSVCTVLLLLGFAAIRSGWVTVHKTCMLTALAVSATFLASYLYYHIVVRHGVPTQFSGPGEVRAVYLGILLSHTVLAAVIAPVALVTAYLGLTGRIDRHKNIARWTLPIWLYVSITGVVVYWMLYHLYPAA